MCEFGRPVQYKCSWKVTWVVDVLGTPGQDWSITNNSMCIEVTTLQHRTANANGLGSPEGVPTGWRPGPVSTCLSAGLSRRGSVICYLIVAGVHKMTFRSCRGCRVPRRVESQWTGHPVMCGSSSPTVVVVGLSSKLRRGRNCVDAW